MFPGEKQGRSVYRGRNGQDRWLQAIGLSIRGGRTFPSVIHIGLPAEYVLLTKRGSGPRRLAVF